MTRGPSRRGTSPIDPRYCQLTVLGGLLTYGLFALDFDLSPAQVVATFVAVLVTQAVGQRLTGQRIDLRSALITGCSLSLLLRTNLLGMAALAGVIAIGSKFTLRAGSKHLFNPANLGIVVLLAANDRVWVSPGQWGSVALFAFLMACLGTLVVTRASRADVTLTFLAAYAALVFGRAWWVGDPMTIPLHRLQSGALLLFAFFMISDPKTTPDSRAGRVLFAIAVAAVAWYIPYQLFRNNGLMWALALLTPLVPLADRWLPGPPYSWTGQLDRPPAIAP
jgi:Na+-transporting NADH:ubiquinone oxidoreductase subunit NqrB